MSLFYWDDLLEDITRHRRVVPVIGLDLLGGAESGSVAPFYRELIARTAEKLGPACSAGLPEDADFSQFVATTLPKFRSRAEFTRALSAAHRELLAALTPEALPEPLRLLAEITDFPLILTTCIDGHAGRALGVDDDAALVSTLSENSDLPPTWQPPARGATPALVHLFGRIAAMPGFALTEEDMLEFMWSLQGERRPSRLLSRLRRSDVLLLGTRFPDWLARFFLRLLRGERLSVEGETFETIVDPEAQPSRPLVAFLQAFSPQTRIYHEGSTADFVRELHRRWKVLQPDAAPRPAGAVSVDDYGEPEDMRAGSIFVSYASEDRNAAGALAAALDHAGLDVWFDRNELRGGDRYVAKIRSHIQRCDLFVPLMSRHTEERQNAFFRREWTWARECLPAIAPSRPFMMPLVIDNLDPSTSPDLAHYFEMPGREVHASRVPDGVPDEHVVQDFIRAIRRVRAPRAAITAASAA